MKNLFLLFIYLFFNVANAKAQHPTGDSLKKALLQNQNFLWFYEEMRDVCKMYIDNGTNVTQAKMEEVKSYCKTLYESNKRREAQSDSMYSFIQNPKLNKEFVERFMQQLDSMQDVYAKQGITLQQKFDQYEKNDISERTYMNIREQAYRIGIVRAKQFLYALLSDMPFLREVGTEITQTFRNTIKELDKKHNHYVQDTCKKDALEGSIESILSFFHRATILKRSSKPEKDQNQFYFLSFHTDIMQEVYRYNACLGR